MTFLFAGTRGVQWVWHTPPTVLLIYSVVHGDLPTSFSLVSVSLLQSATKERCATRMLNLWRSQVVVALPLRKTLFPADPNRGGDGEIVPEMNKRIEAKLRLGVIFFFS